MNNFNPLIHHRRSIRLKEYDYSTPGYYFITICCYNKIHRFGKIENETMCLNEFGEIALKEWQNLPEQFSDIGLGLIQIMPNHIHFIIIIKETVGAGFTPAQEIDEHLASAQNQDLDSNLVRDNNDNNVWVGVKPTPTSDVIRNFKSRVANACLDVCKSNNEEMGKFWQKNYYEHIIRNEEDYCNIYNYIYLNPVNWDKDEMFS